MTTETKKKSIPEMGLDSRLLLKRMLESTSGETISYQEMSEIIGRDVQGEARPMLYSARRAALSDNVAFSTIHKVGLRRCDDTEIVNQLQSGIHRIHKSARRTAKVARALNDISKCDQRTRDRFNVSMSLLAVIDHATSTKTAKKLEEKISKIGGTLPTAKMLEELK